MYVKLQVYHDHGKGCNEDHHYHQRGDDFND
jgi:hypothetical protein